MMHMNETVHIHDEAASYALHALPPAEVAAVEGHAAKCPSCQKELDESFDAAQLLALTVPVERPPARCKLGLMQRIENDSFLHRPTRSATRSRLLTWLPVAAAFALLITWNVSLQSNLGTSRQQAATLNAQLVASQQTATALTTAMQRNHDNGVMILDSEATHPLNPQMAMASAVQAKVFMTHGKNSALLMLKNLPALPPGKIYMVWVASENEQQRCTAFKTEGDMYGIKVESPRALDTYKWIMITIEDDADSDQPSNQTVLLGDL